MPLLNTRTSELPAGFSGGDGQGYTRDVQDNELTSTAITGLLADNGAYLNNARLRGTEFAASRQLGNSSIAAGASERAAIESALPIAQGDAGAYQDAAGQNIAALNQYEIADRGNESSERNAQTAANASMTNARIAADTQLQALAASLGFQGQQADLDRIHQVTMGNLAFDQNLQTMAYNHGLDLDGMAASAFYDMQQMAAIDNMSLRNQGLSFVSGAYNNYSNTISNALYGDFDTAAFQRIVQSADNMLSNSIQFGNSLFSNFPAFDFNFSSYGGGGG